MILFMRGCLRPSPLPHEWNVLLEVLAHLDNDFIPENKVFEMSKKRGGLTEIQSRKVLTEMSEHGLLRWSGNYINIEDRSFPLIAKIQNNET